MAIIVWRFVAGLTEFQHLDGHIYSKRSGYIDLFVMQCLFEAQTMEYFGSYFASLRSPKKLIADDSYHLDAILPLDAYACGYCIANILTGMSFSIHVKSFLLSHNFQHFICGLKTNVPSVGYIEELLVHYQVISLRSDLAFCSLQRLTSLGIRCCRLNETDMIHLSELIPSMTCLKKLDISGNVISCVQLQEDCFVKILQALSHSRVTILDIRNTGFCENQSELFLAALKQLLDPSDGRLKELLVGEHAWQMNSKVVDYLSAHSSLESLTLNETTPSLLSPLTSNTCLTKLHVMLSSSSMLEIPEDFMYRVSELVFSNRTLKHLTIESFQLPQDYSALKILVNSLYHNKTLLKLTVGLEYPPISHEMVTAFEYARKHGTELTLE